MTTQQQKFGQGFTKTKEEEEKSKNATNKPDSCSTKHEEKGDVSHKDSCSETGSKEDNEKEEKEEGEEEEEEEIK